MPNETAEPVRVAQTTYVPLALFIIVCTVSYWQLEGVMQWYGSALLLYLGGKLLLSVLPVSEPPAPVKSIHGRYTIGAVITVYNEDPATLEACMRSLENQTMPPDYTVIVDDCSDVPVSKYWNWDIYGEVIHQPKNFGKRHALARGFDAMPGVDKYVCIDSDAILEPNAIELGMAEFNRPGVVAVTGVATALNYKANLLTRLIDLRYINAFLGERSAYSRLGSVLCVTGVLAFWTGSIIRDNQEEFLNQKFRGKPQTSGDDRHLTNIHQLYGKVVLARRAVAATVVPEKVGHYLRQQSRWGRSFWRESIWALQNLSPRSIAWWLSALEMVATAAFTFGLVIAMIVSPIMNQGFGVTDYLTWVCIGAWGRSVHAFAVRRGDRWLVDALIGFATAPLFGLLCLFIVMPVRIYALLTLSKTGWGTRNVVEVKTGPTTIVTNPLEHTEVLTAVRPDDTIPIAIPVFYNTPRHKYRPDAVTIPTGIDLTQVAMVGVTS